MSDRDVKVNDACTINADIHTVFSYLTKAEYLKKWWPKDCRSISSDERKLRLVWFNDSTADISFDIFEEPARVAFDFYHERCEFNLKVLSETRTAVDVEHGKISFNGKNLDDVIHIAQCWASLFKCLKAVIEHDIDLRDEIS